MAAFAGFARGKVYLAGYLVPPGYPKNPDVNLSYSFRGNHYGFAKPCFWSKHELAQLRYQVEKMQKGSGFC